MQYAQGLLGQASQATPVASPWQAAARGLSGVLGGLGMRDYGQQYQRTLAGEIDEARRTTQGALSGIGQTAAPPPGTPPTAAPQAATAPANLDALLSAASTKSGIPKPVLVGLYKHESNFDPAAVNATSGATGLGQVLMSTALKPGYGLPPLADNEDAAKAALLDPAKNVDFSSQYLAARGKDLFGDKWNPNDETQIKAALNAYGDGTAGYADQVLGKGGWNVPPVTVAQNDATTNPQANLQAGWQAALQLQTRLATMAASPNPYVRAAVPQLAQIANTLKTVGLWSPVGGTDPDTGQQILRNNMTGDTKAVGAGLRPEGVAMRDLARLAPIAQADPNLMRPDDRQRLLTAITQIYKPTTKLQEDTGIRQTFFEKPPPAWVNTFMGIDAQGRPITADGGAGAGAGAATTPEKPPASPAEIKAGIERATEDYKADVETTSKFAAAAASGDDTLAANQSIRSILASGKVKPGQFAPFMAQVASVMRGASYDEQAVQKITGMDPVAAQELNKFLFQLQSSKLREMGAREPGSVLQMFASNYPNWQSRPETIGALTRTLDMQVLYAKDRAAAMTQWMQEHRGNIADYQRVSSPAFNDWFKAQHDPREYAAAALAASTAGDGKPVPYKEWAEGLKDKAAVDRVTGLVNQAYPGSMVDYGAHGVGQAGGP
jgi:hypothetical protein